MTQQAKKTRIDKLAENPAFFYRTLREAVEQLDATKQAFQFLLAAHERMMDPAVKAQYEQDKQTDRQETLRANPTGLPLRTIPIDKVPLGPVTVIKGDGIQDDTAALKAAGGLHLSASVPVKLAPDNYTLATAYKETKETKEIKETAAAVEEVGLSDAALKDAAQMALMGRAAQEINRMLKEKGIELTEAQLYDYMDKKLSREDLRRIIDKSNPTAEQLAASSGRAAPAAPAQAIVPGDEFELTQIGAAQKMFYGEQGLLAKILSPTVHRYGKGSVGVIGQVKAEHVSNQVSNTGHYYLRISTPSLERGVFEYAPGCFGLLLPVFSRVPNNPDPYWLWLPMYSAESTLVPTIYVCTTPVVFHENHFTPLHSLKSATVSDLVNRAVHALVQWIKELEIAETQFAEMNLLSKELGQVGSAERRAEPQPTPKQAVLPSDSKQYPPEHDLGRIQTAVYGAGGYLSRVLSNAVHWGPCTGTLSLAHGAAEDVPVNTARGQGIRLDYLKESGLYFTQSGMEGLFIRPIIGADKVSAVSFWLPLYRDSTQPMPSLYVCTDTSNVFYNLDTYLGSERSRFWDLLLMGITQLTCEHTT